MSRVVSVVLSLVVLAGCTYPDSLTTTATSAPAVTTVPTATMAPSETTEPTEAAQPAGAIPSQTPADAVRDGVVAELAAASFDERVEVRASGETDEGTWVLSYPPDGNLSCPSSDPGVYGVDWVCAWEYSEILLLGAHGLILRAYPMPGLPATWLHVDEDAVYAGQVGDGGLPDSTLVRIDRGTLELSGWVFPFWEPTGVDGEYGYFIDEIVAGRWLEGWAVAAAEESIEDLVSVGENTVGGVPVESWIGDGYVNMELVREFFASHAGCDVTSSTSAVPTADEQVAVVYFQCGPESSFPAVDTRVERIVSAAMTPLEATLRALLSGPTPSERNAGLVSFFDGASAAALDSVTVNGTRAQVNFNDAIYINNASTSTGGMFFMAELRANVFQFDEIDSVVWSVNGNCEAFGEWLQVGECMTDTRSEWEQMLTAWEELEP